MAPADSRWEIRPLDGHQVSLLWDGAERLRWHAGADYPRPFFFPLQGPSGLPVTRMGHPGAPDHDHHQSIWFAHHRVLGIDFWSNQSPAVIRQKRWLVYDEQPERALMAVELEWLDGHDPRPLLTQELVADVRVTGEGDRETLLELHSTFRPTSASLEFGKTNFGFLAVRVAKCLSDHFGGGRLTNSQGAVGEPAIFAQPATWVDYSGPQVIRTPGKAPTTQEEGITYFDHPGNPRYPTSWHVRADGWMGAAVCLKEPLLTTTEKPLRLRYLLHAHSGPVDRSRAEAVAREFHRRPGWDVARSQSPHRMFDLVPRTGSGA